MRIITALVIGLTLPAAADDLTASATDLGLEGTVWVSRGEGPVRKDITYEFEPDGVLVFSYGGATYRTGKWEQDGDRVYFELNQKYRECRATIHGDRIEGRSWNKPGLQWTTVMVRSAKKK